MKKLKHVCNVIAFFTLFILHSSLNIDTAFAQTPDFLWAKSTVGTNDDPGSSIAVDASGNSYVTGYFFSHSITFGSTILTNDTTIENGDIYIVKYDVSGNVVWAKRAGGTGDDYSQSIAVDVSGNSYVTGYFASSSITFGSTTLMNSGINHDMYVVKYDGNGNVVWAKSARGTNDDWGFSIAVDVSGNCYVTGYFVSDSITFGSTTLTVGRMYIVKYDGSGNVLWAKSPETGYGVSNSIAVDASGNCYVTGYFFSGSITFGSTTLTSNGFTDIYVVKYDGSGNVLWAKSAGGDYYDYGRGIAVDASGNSYVKGYFESSSITFGSTTLMNNGVNIFIVKYDGSGNVVWAKSAGGSDYYYSSCIAVDASGNCYVTGSFNSDSITFGSTTLTSNGVTDIYVVKYDDSGNVVWAKSAGGTNSDYGYSIAVDTSGNSYVTGQFASSSITFGLTTLTNSGYSMFVTKIGVVDTTKYRTFKNTTAMGAKAASLKKKKGQPTPLPNVGNWRDTVVNRFGGKNGLTLGVVQTDKNAAKNLGWIRYKKGADMLKFYTQLDTNRAYNAPFDTVRKAGASKKKRFVKEVAPNIKAYTNPLAQVFGVFKLNLASSIKGVTPKGFDSLVYVNEGSAWNNKSLSQISNWIDTVLTYYQTRNLYDTVKAKVGSPQLQELSEMLTAINNAFYDSIDVLNGDTLKSDGLKFSGVVKINDVPFLQRLTNVKTEQLSGAITIEQSVPELFSLEQNYPNPFNPTTNVRFTIADFGLVSLKIYNVLGQEVATLLNNEQLEEGTHEVQFDASRFSSGVYFYRLTSTSENKTFVDIKKMVLLR